MSIRKLLVLLLLVPMFVIAQSGKIAGVVSDTDTGEPLVGVNVVLDNTTMGAMTDIDGYYVILNVPANTYDIRASYIGYKDVVVEGARVSSGVTTNQNFTLTQTTLELEEAVVVRAERPLVEKNVTQSYSLVTTESIEAIPVRGLQNILALQASVVVQDGAVHIRGGRTEEVGYYLDGASTSNALNNTNAIYVIQDAIEEVQVLTGGYTAEFGGANSGIIRTQLKSGTPDFHASLDFQTDKFAAEGEEFLGTYSYRHHIASASVSGPILGNKIKFFLAAENYFQGDNQVRFSDGWSFVDLADSNPNRVTDDTVSVSFPNGFTPGEERDRFALNGTVLFDYNPISLKIGGSWSTDDNHGYRYLAESASPQLNAVRDRDIFTRTNTYLVNAKLTHILSPTTYYDVSMSLYGNELEDHDGVMGTNWKQWYDSAAVTAKTGNTLAYRDAWRAAPNYVLNGIPFNRTGAPFANYNHDKQQYLSFAANVTSQIGRHHEVKIGGDAKLYTVRRFNIASSIMRFAADTAYGNAQGFESYGSIDAVPVDLWISTGGVDAYGYDIYGNEIDSDKDEGKGYYTEGPKEPVLASAYIQDKIEYDDLIINAGLRMDYFDSDDKVFSDPSNVAFDSSLFIDRSTFKDKDAVILVSPRLGFSFPVSERTVFYFQYGKFAQLPQLSTIYTSVNNFSDRIFGGFADLNPIGYSLDPIKTTNYEIGFRQQISDVAAFDVTGFYRNIQGQVQPVRVVADGSAEHNNYNRLVNGDFSTTKGLEFKLVLRRTNRLQANLNYTLTDAQGSGSNTTSYIAALEQGTNSPTVVNPLDYAQTHRGSINLDYRFGQNDGGPVLENFGANVLFTFNSGHPYTRVLSTWGQADPYIIGVDYMYDSRAREALEPINNSTTPWNYNIDLRLDKSFNITDKISAMLYMRVNNLLNTKNVINVYQTTGTASDDGWISDPTNIEAALADANLGQTYLDMYKALNSKNGGAYADWLGLELYGPPRQIFFGIKLTY